MNAKAVPIVDIIQTYSGVTLTKKGNEYWTCCPLHGEKTPSLSCNPEKNLWHCVGGCGGGSGIDFVMKINGVDFKTAAATIERDFRIQRDRQPRSRPVRSSEQFVRERIEKVFDFCFLGRQALQTEMKRRGENVPPVMIRDLGRLEIVSEELVGEPTRIATGLRLFRGWFPWVR